MSEAGAAAGSSSRAVREEVAWAQAESHAAADEKHEYASDLTHTCHQLNASMRDTSQVHGRCMFEGGMHIVITTLHIGRLSDAF